jgi:hypothetical protein
VSRSFRGSLRVPRFVRVYRAAPVFSVLLSNGCGLGAPAPNSAPHGGSSSGEMPSEQVANTIRTYDPKTGALSNRAGELSCRKPSVHGWEQSATEYQQAVRASILELYGTFAACYSAQLRKNASTSGTSCLRLNVSADGQVTKAELDTASLPEALQDCVLRDGSRANIPPPKKSPIIVMVPLTFVKR